MPDPVKSDSRPIGLFDSGIGGLTVLRELLVQFPNENFIYLGDTARLPYGNKSPANVRKFSEQNMSFLKKQNVKAIIIACNTASTQVPENNYLDLPVYNVISPGISAALKKTDTKKIAILGTQATITANAYEKKIKEIDSEIKVFNKACPLFVPLVEEGLFENEATKIIAEMYLKQVCSFEPDTLVLGCTHYPLLKDLIQKIVGLNVHLIDSGLAICEILKNDFNQLRLIENQPQSSEKRGTLKICLTDQNNHFYNLSKSILKNVHSSELDLITVSVTD